MALEVSIDTFSPSMLHESKLVAKDQYMLIKSGSHVLHESAFVYISPTLYTQKKLLLVGIVASRPESAEMISAAH